MATFGTVIKEVYGCKVEKKFVTAAKGNGKKVLMAPQWFAQFCLKIMRLSSFVTWKYRTTKRLR